MKFNYWIAGYTVALCLVALTALTPPFAAGGVTERERQDCRADYQVGSGDLRKCMSRSIRKLSNACVNALVDAGEMTRAQASARHKSSKHKSSSKSRSHYHKKAH
jgi:hypothetical protein